jgi:hypothetical protein
VQILSLGLSADNSKRSVMAAYAVGIAIVGVVPTLIARGGDSSGQSNDRFVAI